MVTRDDGHRHADRSEHLHEIIKCAGIGVFGQVSRNHHEIERFRNACQILDNSFRHVPWITGRAFKAEMQVGDMREPHCRPPRPSDKPRAIFI